MNDVRRDAPSARVAISVVFFVNGVTFASWTPRLPEIQDRLGISDAALGITLVGAGVGGLVASAVSGRLVDRFGSRTMTLVTSAGLSMALPLNASRGDSCWMGGALWRVDVPSTRRCPCERGCGPGAGIVPTELCSAR